MCGLSEHSQGSSWLRPLPIEPLFQDADAEHGLRTVAQVQVFVLRRQGHLVLLVPLLLLLQFLSLLGAEGDEQGEGVN